MYKITGWFPNAKQQLGGCGFCIILTPKWKEAVINSSLTQEKIDNLIANLGKPLLEGHGRSCYLDSPNSVLKISWGEWGVEHISVPGNACGLDIDSGFSLGCKNGERCLLPHNVDSIGQASMILALFLKIAEYLECEI